MPWALFSLPRVPLGPWELVLWAHALPPLPTSPGLVGDPLIAPLPSLCNIGLVIQLVNRALGFWLGLCDPGATYSGASCCCSGLLRLLHDYFCL